MADMIRVGVLTISDRCSRRESEDASGPAIQSALPAAHYVVALYAVIPDDRKVIQETLRRWADEYACDVILTTGGTGLSPRDHTPEATSKVIDRDVPGIPLYLIGEGLKTLPTAALSRGIAGTRGRTLIVNLPGSPGAASDYTRLLCNLMPHAVSVIRGDDARHPVAAS